jgi:hypothetical protein
LLSTLQQEEFPYSGAPRMGKFIGEKKRSEKKIIDICEKDHWLGVAINVNFSLTRLAPSKPI